MEAIKVFRMNDCDWYAGETAEDASRAMAGWNGYAETPEGIEQAKKELTINPVELTPEEMEGTQFAYVDGDDHYIGRMCFRERLAEMIADGDEFPSFFASTEY
jgi:hypothetical protein